MTTESDLARKALDVLQQAVRWTMLRKALYDATGDLAAGSCRTMRSLTQAVPGTAVVPIASSHHAWTNG
jgi:hypothetical protein